MLATQLLNMKMGEALAPHLPAGCQRLLGGQQLGT